MLSRASIAASARSGMVRARRPSRTMHSSSAIADTDSTTSLDGRLAQQLLERRASVAAPQSSERARRRSRYRPITIAEETDQEGDDLRGAASAEAGRGPNARIGMLSSGPRTLGGRGACTLAAASTATASVGPCTIAREIIPDTTCPAS